MLSKIVLASVSLYLAAEGYSLMTAPTSLLRQALAKVERTQPPPSASNQTL